MSDAAGRRLLILNWRDPWHPKSGGAELFTLRVAQQLRVRGWKIEWFSAAYEGAAPEEMRDGIRYIRAGGQMTVHVRAFIRYRSRQKFDVVIDEINTIPFFAHFYMEAPAVVLMFQLAREVWLSEAPAPLSYAGFISEPAYFQAYRNNTIVTISESSAESFRRLGHRGPVHVVPIAVDEEPDATVPQKSAAGDIIVVGRVTPSKRVADTIHAAKLLAGTGWAGTLHIVGGGDAEYAAYLRRLASELGIADRVIFHGRVSDDERSALLRRASVLWMASLREGWGLVVTEAGRHATPAVVYDVPGLRDAVKDGVTGRVVSPNPAALADATQQLLAGDRDTFAKAALDDSLRYSWEATANAVERVLMDAIAGER